MKNKTGKGMEKIEGRQGQKVSTKPIGLYAKGYERGQRAVKMQNLYKNIERI